MKLGVNIDHIATLRNARGQDNPNLIRALKVCQETALGKKDWLSTKFRVSIQDIAHHSLKTLVARPTL